MWPQIPTEKVASTKFVTCGFSKHRGHAHNLYVPINKAYTILRFCGRFPLCMRSRAKSNTKKTVGNVQQNSEPRKPIHKNSRHKNYARQGFGNLMCGTQALEPPLPCTRSRVFQTYQILVSVPWKKSRFLAADCCHNPGQRTSQRQTKKSSPSSAVYIDPNLYKTIIVCYLLPCLNNTDRSTIATVIHSH